MPVLLGSREVWIVLQNAKAHGHESLFATGVTKYIQMSLSYLYTQFILCELPLSSVQ